METNFSTPTLLLAAATLLNLGTGCSSREQNTGAQNSAQTAQMGSQEASFDGFDDFGDFDDDVTTISDPFEPVNRAVFAFNDKAYDLVFRPLSNGYKTITPEPVRKSIGNFFTNLAYPVRLLNSALQGKIDRAGRETGKFLVNTTAGVFGLFTVSDNISALEDVPSEDLGQTLGVWGIESGPYIVIPILGPSSARDLVGRFGDSYAHPYEWTEHVWDDWEWEIEWSLRSVEIVNGLPEAVDRYDTVNQIAVDPYSAVRDAYIQSRKNEIKK